MVLQLAAAIHAHGVVLDNTVFILDELENHLHPSVAIDLLEKLNNAAPSAQIWVATHSIPLLAYILSIEPMALWYMEDGKVTHAGRHTERVLSSLLGDETRIGQLHALTGLPAQLASTNYAVESLLPPETLAVQDNDPQINQIASILGKRASGKALSVLDFGAGKGRLLEGLAVQTRRPSCPSGLIIMHLMIHQKTKRHALPLSLNTSMCLKSGILIHQKNILLSRTTA